MKRAFTRVRGFQKLGSVTTANEFITLGLRKASSASEREAVGVFGNRAFLRVENLTSDFPRLCREDAED